MSEGAILTTLNMVNQEHCDPPLAGSELASIAASVSKYPSGDDVKKKVSPDRRDKKPGEELTLDEPEPWPDPVDGAELLNELVEIILRYLVLPDGAAEAMALWVVHAHTIETAEITPRLAFLSPVKRCGKTQALNILYKLACRPILAASITPASVYRAVEAVKPTLLVDEADTFLRDNDQLRGVLNSGHHRTGFRLLTEGEGRHREVRKFSTFAPLAIALIGKLPETLDDRSIVIHMRRKKRNERVERLRTKSTPELDTLARKCARWALDNIECLEGAEPKIPEALHDRAADNWEHLLAIADLAGGAWPLKARTVAVTLSGDIETEASSIKVQLLIDIQQIFDRSDTDRLPSQAICDALAEMEDRPWPEFSRKKPITTSQLAKHMKSFEVSPKDIRFKDGVKKGYEWAFFEDAFSRYIPPFPSATAQQVSGFNHLGENISATEPSNVADKKDEMSLDFKDVADVAVEKEGIGGPPSSQPLKELQIWEE
jgi:putative DNA primase/helicase